MVLKSGGWVGGWSGWVAWVGKEVCVEVRERKEKRREKRGGKRDKSGSHVPHGCHFISLTSNTIIFQRCLHGKELS